jgi:hypothetical protein
MVDPLTTKIANHMKGFPIGFYVVSVFKATDRWEIVGLKMAAIVFGSAAGLVLKSRTAKSI